MRKPIVSRTLALRKYRCFIRDRTEVKEVILAIPHGPKTVSKGKEKLSEIYRVTILDVIETWEEKELYGMEEIEFYLLASPLTEDRKIKK